MCRGFSGLDSGVIGTFDGNSWGLILAFTDNCLLVGDLGGLQISVDFAPVLSSGMPLYAGLNESTEPESSCSTSEHVPLIEFCKFPTPVCKKRGILPTWQQAVGSTWMLVQEGDGESVSRDLRIDQVPERGDRGGGMIDMLRKEGVI
jgi:hypothetical protein